MPALSVSLSAPSTEGLAGLAIAPNSELYVAANAVYRLGPDGIPHWVVGRGPLPNYCWDCNPGNQNDFLGAERLAFDGKGDLLVAGGPGWGLYEMTRSGKLRFVSVFRGDGFWGSLAEAAGETVVLSVPNGIFRILPSGAWEPIDPPPMAGFSRLDAALGKGNIFIGGTGLVVAENGDIYVDTNPGNTFTRVSAILELHPNGSVVALWKSCCIRTEAWSHSGSPEAGLTVPWSRVIALSKGQGPVEALSLCPAESEVGLCEAMQVNHDNHRRHQSRGECYQGEKQC